MRFLVDECTGPNVASWLRDNDFEVFSVFEDARGRKELLTPTTRFICRCHRKTGSICSEMKLSTASGWGIQKKYSELFSSFNSRVLFINPFSAVFTLLDRFCSSSNRLKN